MFQESNAQPNLSLELCEVEGIFQHVVTGLLCMHHFLDLDDLAGK